MLSTRWFENNYMKFSKDKWHLRSFCYKHEQLWENIGKHLIKKINDAKLPGITIDEELKIDKHVLKLCSQTNQKLRALSRMVKLLSF